MQIKLSLQKSNKVIHTLQITSSGVSQLVTEFKFYRKLEIHDKIQNQNKLNVLTLMLKNNFNENTLTFFSKFMSITFDNWAKNVKTIEMVVALESQERTDIEVSQKGSVSPFGSGTLKEGVWQQSR